MQLLTSPFFTGLLSPSNCEKTLTLIWVEGAGGKHPFRAGKIRAEINPSPQSHTRTRTRTLSHTHTHTHTHIHTPVLGLTNHSIVCKIMKYFTNNIQEAEQKQRS